MRGCPSGEDQYEICYYQVINDFVMELIGLPHQPIEIDQFVEIDSLLQTAANTCVYGCYVHPAMGLL